MKAGEIIATHRKKAGLSQQQLASKLAEAGIEASFRSISNWEKSVSEPSVGTFLTLCRLLGVDDIYQEYFGHNPYSLTNGINALGISRMHEFAGLLRESEEFSEKTAPTANSIRKIRFYTLRPSAGLGNFLDSDDYEEIDVGDEVPASADFGLRIAGDSMEPLFADHQIIWVHQQDDLCDGEIGVFDYNGNAYFKKLRNRDGQISLISLNAKYAPMNIRKNDDFKIFGKVVG